MQKVTVEEHYDLLIQENNDPVNDPPVLQNYMNKWDGQSFIDSLELDSNDNLLEIGVGTGRLAKIVLDIGCGHFTGIDISSATIARAKDNLNEWKNTSLICGDFISYAFHQTFDTIYSSLTLFHFKDKAAFIRKVAGLLSAKGRVVLSVPKEKEDSITYGSREIELYPDDIDELKTLLINNGLAIHSVIEVDFAHIIVAENA